MPEAFVEAEELRAEITQLHPEWLTSRPVTRSWHDNKRDWQHDFWKRVRLPTAKMSKIVTAVDEGKLDQARDEARVSRQVARQIGHSIEGLRLDTAHAWYAHEVPGWDGRPFEAWRAFSEARWWETLVLRQHQTSLDWLEPWLKLDRIHDERPKWVTFWTQECAKERLPREWLRWAMREVQALRKVTAGTPVDNQIATYLLDYDIFVTGDRAFVDCIDVIRQHAPARIAASSLSPAGSRAVDHLLELFEQASARGFTP
jgi:hypothetical protein